MGERAALGLKLYETCQPTNPLPGQKFGKATYDPKTRVFINVSPGAIEALWESFNDVADGFGINLCEMQMICQDLTAELELDRSMLNKKVEELFVQIGSWGY